MSSTNKTTNYELSQFLGGDKPAWLSDYNTDMSKIDTQMKANADAATAAGGSATTANTAIGTLANLTTTAKTDLVSAINEVDGNADTAQGTANDASTTANSALTTANNLATYLNVGTTNVNLTSSDISKSGIGTIASASNIHIVGNTDKSLVKIYGEIYLQNGTPGSRVDFTINNTTLAPSSNITINSCGLKIFQDGNTVVAVDPLSYTINTNGTITFSLTPYIGSGASAKFLATLIFVKNFGDE